MLGCRRKAEGSRVGIFVLVFLNSCLCFAQEKKGPNQEVDGFSLVQYKEAGEKKWELSGKSAKVEENKIKIDYISALAFGETVTIKLKAREGDFSKQKNLVHLENDVVVKATDGIMLTTDSLNWDAETKNVFTDERVEIKKSDFQVNGKGAVCDLENKTAEVKKEVRANITSVTPAYLRPKGVPSDVEGRTTEGGRKTTITCDGPLELDYKKNRSTFKNNVKVEDSEGTIFADRIDVYYRPATRRIKCVAARGNVKIINDGNVTYSEKAIYLVDEGRVVLPKRPKLVIQNNANTRESNANIRE